MARKLTAASRAGVPAGDRPAAGSTKRQRVFLALAASGLILSGGFATIAMASRNPVLLSAMAPWSAVAAGKILDAKVLAARTPGELQSLKPQLIDVLRHEPMDFRAARSIAFIELTENRSDAARRMLQTVGRNTKREALTHVWLMNDAFEKKRHDDFLLQSEIVMRVKPETSQQVFLMLTKLIDDGALVEPVATALAEKPFWRPAFFDAFGSASKNNANALRLYATLKRKGSPASSSEQRVWLLTQVGKVDTERLVAWWSAIRSQPLPDSEAGLRNGNFEGSSAPQPFDWTFYIPDGSFAEVSSSPSGAGHSLYVEMEGSSDQSVARQILTLQPGRYRLSYDLYPISDLSSRGLTVSILCGKGTNFVPLNSQTAAGPADQWTRKTQDFTIPADCTTQQISIDLKPGGFSTEVQAYFDNMAVKPIP